MAKSTSVFVCNECGYKSPKWLGRCPDCGAWSSFSEEIVEQEKSKSAFAPTTKAVVRPVRLSEIKKETFDRISSGIPELDTALGGGIVPASLVLIGGDPGIGKSTLLTEVAGNLSKDYKVLYVSAEESASQIKLRATRLGVDEDNFLIMNETCVNNVEECLDGVEFLIIDSIQAVYLEELSSTAGSVSQVRECAGRFMKIAKSKRITTFIVGHVTKEGAIAGPKVLEHVMDTVLYFEGDKTENFRLLRAVKNRFGATDEIGVFEMRDNGIFGVKDYKGIFISSDRLASAGSVVFPSVSGNRALPVEIQSLTSKTAFGMPRRMAIGIDYNKLAVLIAVSEKKASVPFYTEDAYVSAMGGIKLNEPAVDLAVIVSLVSSNKNAPLPPDLAVFGEVGLNGEVRPVSFAEKRVAECIRNGFKQVMLPYANLKSAEKYKDKIKPVPVKYVFQAVQFINNYVIKE